MKESNKDSCYLRYDRSQQTRKYIQKMQLMAAMGPPGGGRNVISERLLTRFNVINMTFPAEKQVSRIYGTMLSQHLVDFHPEVKGLGKRSVLVAGLRALMIFF